MLAGGHECPPYEALSCSCTITPSHLRLTRSQELQADESPARSVL